MTTEDPDMYDESVIGRIAEYESTIEFFPDTPIETIAQMAYEKLLELRDKIEESDDAEGLVQPLDIRMRIWLNHMFVKNAIQPIVGRLLSRTEPQGVNFGRKKRWGYEYAYKADQSEHLIAFSPKKYDLIDLDETGAVQRNWDSGTNRTRKRLKQFAAMTAPQIIDRFIIFTEGYLDPKELGALAAPDNPESSNPTSES